MSAVVQVAKGRCEAMIDNLGFRAAFNGEEASPDSLFVADGLANTDAASTSPVVGMGFDDRLRLPMLDRL